MKTINLKSAETSIEIRVLLKKEENKLYINFAPFKFDLSDEKFSLTHPCKNWGLWNFDVCEVFLKKENEEKYDEYQVSPLNQKFHLEIFKPREIYFTPFKCNFITKIQEGVVSFEIPIDESKWEIGLFACIGKGKDRKYFSHFKPDGIIDFHRPEKFMKLD